MALQYGLEQALAEHGLASLQHISFGDDSKQMDMPSIEAIGEATLRHAHDALSEEPCDGDLCSVLSVGLPLRSKLHGGNPIGMSWFRRLVTSDVAPQELSVDDILALIDDA